MTKVILILLYLTIAIFTYLDYLVLRDCPCGDNLRLGGVPLKGVYYV